MTKESILTLSYNNKKGFSLVEVLISIAILSFMMIGFNSIISSTARNTTTMTEEDRETFDTEISIDRMKKDYLHIYTPAFIFPSKSRKKNKDNEASDDTQSHPNFPATSDQGHLFPLFNYNKDSLLIFTSTNIRKHKDSKESEYAWVYYALKPKDEILRPEAQYELHRTFVNTNIYDPALDIPAEKSYLFIDNIKKLEF